MKMCLKILTYILYIFIVFCEVKSECDGVYDCLKAFLNGDIGSDSSDTEIKIFELNNTPIIDNVELFNTRALENANFNINKESNSFIDKIKDIFSFKKDTTTVVYNYTISTSNWTLTYKTDIISNVSFPDNKNIIKNKTNNSNYVYDFPNVHNATVKKYISKDHQKSLTKHVINNKFSDVLNLDDQSYNENEKNSTDFDYAIIDYIALYEDTTNELIDLPTTENTMTNETESNFGPTEQSELMHQNLDLIEENKDTFGFETPFQKLNDVLDDYAHKDVEDLFIDYPEIKATYAPKEITTSINEITTNIDELTTTEDSGFQFLVLPQEAAHLCKSRRALVMERIVGLPFDEENYWDGFFYSNTFKGLKKAELVLDLTTAVNITAIENAVVTRINDTSYAITGLDPSKEVRFKVQALPGEGFPFLKKVTLNGREFCKKRRQWRPTLLGTQNQAVISPLISPHQEGPYYCGRSQINFSPLVVKGRPTKEGDYPWHVALFIKNLDTKNWDYSCGGTILHRKTIITAAHCVVGKDGTVLDKKRLLVIAGKYRIYEVDSNQIPLKIKKIIVHENYTNTHSTLKDDLALLILEDHVQYGQYIQPICQWNSEQEEKEIVYQEHGTIVGWGSTENETLAETLLAASMRVIHDHICLKSRPSFFKRYISDNTFCAGNKNGTSACNGDSGGGLIFPIRELDGKTSWYLRGVVSVGVRRAGGLCDPEHYVVFTDVVRYRHWVEEYQEL